jgi:hypothetical protein
VESFVIRVFSLVIGNAYIKDRVHCHVQACALDFLVISAVVRFFHVDINVQVFAEKNVLLQSFADYVIQVDMMGKWI